MDGQFCNPVSVNFRFTEDDKDYDLFHLYHDTFVGDYVANGTTHARLNSPTPPSCSGSAKQCDNFAIDNTRRGKPARLEFEWNVHSLQNGIMAGGTSCSDFQPCGKVNEYDMGQHSATELWCKMTFNHLDLLDYLFAGTRTMYFAFDTDVNLLTGDNSLDLCGADYRVKVVFTYPGGTTPATYTTAVEAYDMSASAWLPTGATPSDFAFDQQYLGVTVFLDQIGNPSTSLAGWAVLLEPNLAPVTMPCDPCSQRPTLVTHALARDVGPRCRGAQKMPGAVDGGVTDRVVERVSRCERGRARRRTIQASIRAAGAEEGANQEDDACDTRKAHMAHGCLYPPRPASITAERVDGAPERYAEPRIQ